MGAIFVGIDVAKDRLDICVRPSGESFVIARTGSGIEHLAERLKKLEPHIVAIEATGGFETVVAAGLAGAALPIVVVNPAQVRAFAQALGKRAKTDPIDAAVIAHFAEATKASTPPDSRRDDPIARQSHYAAASDHRDDGGRRSARAAYN